MPWESIDSRFSSTAICMRAASLRPIITHLLRRIACKSSPRYNPGMIYCFLNFSARLDSFSERYRCSAKSDSGLPGRSHERCFECCTIQFHMPFTHLCTPAMHLILFEYPCGRAFYFHTRLEKMRFIGDNRLRMHY